MLGVLATLYRTRMCSFVLLHLSFPLSCLVSPLPPSISTLQRVVALYLSLIIARVCALSLSLSLSLIFSSRSLSRMPCPFPILFLSPFHCLLLSLVPLSLSRSLPDQTPPPPHPSIHFFHSMRGSRSLCSLNLFNHTLCVCVCGGGRLCECVCV